MNTLSRWCLLAGFALAIFGGKLLLIDHAGGDLPVLDQWDAEGETLLRPWLEHRLDFAILAHPHNEHRLITTKLFVLGLFIANGQWDGLVEMTAAAVVHTGFAVLLLLLARRWLRGPPLVLFAVLLLLLFLPPFAWENTLNGFQVQFYFLLIFSVGHMWLALDADRIGKRWAAGQICGILAVATMASGLLSAVAVLLVLAARAAARRRLTAAQGATAAIAVALIVAGWLSRTVVPQHELLQAHNAGQFLSGLLHALAWPSPAWLPFGIVPAGLFVYHRIRRHDWGETDAVLLALLIWSWINCIAVAYVRGGEGPGIVLSPRYLDLFALNAVLGFVLIQVELPPARRWLPGAAWLLLVAVFVTDSSRTSWHEFIAPLTASRPHQEDHVRAFLETGRVDALRNLTWPEIPYPDGAVLAQRLEPAVIRAILPPSVRDPIPISDATPQQKTVPATLLPTPFSIAFSTFLAGPARIEWHSRLEPAKAFSFLRFRVAGDLDGPSDLLRLSVQTADAEVPVRPESRAGERWKNVTILRPSGDWWVAARDTDPAHWFAFTEPVEIGPVRWFTEKLLKYDLAVLVAAAGLLVIGMVVRRRVRASGTAG